MKLENQTILIVSNEPWNEIWYSKHNYAFELSKKNTVYFINSPEKWTFQNIFKRKIVSKPISVSLTVLSLNNLIPSTFPLLKEINNVILSFQIRRFLRQKKHSNWIQWSFTPLILFRPKLLKTKLSIFHIVDLNWTKFYGGIIFAKRADLLIFVSEIIQQEFEFVTKPKFVIGHGISEDEFNLDKIILQNISKEVESYTNFGLYVGGIDYRLDFNFINQIVSENKAVQFLFVGPVNLPDNHYGLEVIGDKNPNLILLGAKPFKKLKYYVALSCFCITPMDLSVSGNNISHHKTFSYLTQGKPIFGPIFLEYEQLSEIIYQSNDYKVINEYFSKFLSSGEPLELKTKRIQFVQKHRFSIHLEKIAKFINEAHSSHYSK